MFATIANLLGYVLNYIYEFVKNYGIAIILFTILLKIVWLPISIWQQKSMKKSARIQEESNKLQTKYKNDPEKLNQEIIELYRREKTNPLSGCVGAILQFVIFISVFYLVSKPLTYMKQLDREVYVASSVTTEAQEDNTVQNEVAEEESNTNQAENTSSEENAINEDNSANEVKEDETAEKKNVSVVEHYLKELEKSGERASYPEIKIIEKYGEEDEKVNLNMEFLGLDLSKVPQQNLTDLKVLIIPILYVLVTFANIKISNNMNNSKKKKDKEKDEKKDDADETLETMQDMTKSMNTMMPFMSIVIAIIAPLGLSLYWLVSNILQLIERVIVDKVMDKKEDEKV